MTTQFKFLALLLSTLFLSGCAACPKKDTTVTPVPAATTKAVAAPVASQTVPEAAPVVSVKPVAKKIPAAVLK